MGVRVLLDVARYKGVECLEPGYAINSEELDATAEAQGDFEWLLREIVQGGGEAIVSVPPRESA